jgi:hypothetical protein
MGRRLAPVHSGRGPARGVLEPDGHQPVSAGQGHRGSSTKNQRDRPRLPELVIYPDSGHGGIFQFHEMFAPVAVEFLGH